MSRKSSEKGAKSPEAAREIKEASDIMMWNSEGGFNKVHMLSGDRGLNEGILNSEQQDERSEVHTHPSSTQNRAKVLRDRCGV
ncbi:hypothetical protein GRJ2_001998600 [Grus japonensis]|uniref:Uncharacterized protein n=1 Tax=Grus japonensis TaxID=30415 RepID=A0ABC9XCE9_GRUJA